MSARQTPYFIWDYDLTDADVWAILRGDDEEQKAWLVARLVESARYEDVWQYISLAELRGIFPKLQLMYFEQGKASGLPVVFGQVADEAAYEKAMAMEAIEVPDELTDRAVYHYYPPLEKVRAWLDQAGFSIEEQGAGDGFHHFLVKKV